MVTQQVHCKYIYTQQVAYCSSVLFFSMALTGLALYTLRQNPAALAA